jgi:nicotinate-nucleotide adenylyltransferase
MPPLIGIFGGTFDPPHIGHLILAAEAHAQLHLTRLLWVLTPDPPHKQGQQMAMLEHRLMMVKKAIMGNPFFELSTVEINRPGPQFALDTVKIIAGMYPSADMAYIMGGDSLRDLPAWHHPADLVAALSIIGVVSRPGVSIDMTALEMTLPGLSARVRFVDAPLLDISSQEIRQRIAEHRPFRYFIPDAVHGYILKHKLYHP